MGENSKDCNGDQNGAKNMPVTNVDKPEVVLNGERENDDESKSLLPSRRGGLSKESGKPRRKVQWNDRNGDKLVQVLEFQPR